MKKASGEIRPEAPASVLPHPVLRRLRCWILGHRYYVVQEFRPWSRRVACDECGGDWGMHDEVRAFVEWSAEMEEMYKIMGYRILKR